MRDTNLSVLGTPHVVQAPERTSDVTTPEPIRQSIRNQHEHAGHLHIRLLSSHGAISDRAIHEFIQPRVFDLGFEHDGLATVDGPNRHGIMSVTYDIYLHERLT